MNAEALAEAKANVTSLFAERDAIEAEMAAISQRLAATGLGLRGSLVDAEGFPAAGVDLYAVRTDRQRYAILRNDHLEMTTKVEKSIAAVHLAAVATVAAKTAAATAHTGSGGDNGVAACTTSTTSHNNASTAESDAKKPRLEDTLERAHDDASRVDAPTATAHRSEDVVMSSEAVAAPSTTNTNTPPAAAAAEPSAAVHGPVLPPPAPFVPLVRPVDAPFAVIDIVTDGSPAHIAGFTPGDRICSFGEVKWDGTGSLPPADMLHRVALHAGDNERVPVTVIVARRGGERTRIVITPAPWSGRGLLGCHMSILR